ncbi:MAG: S-adenosyl-l-methionine hydroxide adenosyltransferase family protein [Acidobacteriota bacterium]
MPRDIVLLTDFGLADPYVGQVKGALLRHAPQARVLDLCHQVEPFNILQAAFFLGVSRQWFPEGTVFVSVVDPGVGGDRRVILLEKHQQYFLAPDNGLLSFVMQHGGASRVRDVTPAWRRDASATFHGRDVFVPLAARLAGDAQAYELGDEVNPHSLARLPGAEPLRNGDVIEATVLHVDRFGNCLTNLDVAGWGPVLFKSKTPSLMVPSVQDLHPVITYEKLAPGELGIIKGSQGYLELAANQRSAAALLGLSSGSNVVITLEKRD